MYSAALLSAALSALALTDAAPTRNSRSAPYSVQLKHDSPSLQARSTGPYSVALKHDATISGAHHARNIVADNAAHVLSRYSERAEEANAPLTNWRRDYMYTVDIEAGTPPQKLTLHVDTGSSSTYLISTNCTVNSCRNSPKYDFEKSSTFELWNTTARKSLTYGSGFASGYWSNDTMAIGPFKVEKQAFLAAYNTDAGYVGSTASGLMGFGFPNLTVGQEQPWWTAAMQSWDDKRFGIYLERADLNKLPPGQAGNQSSGFIPTVGGTLTLGGVSEELFTGDIHYVPVTAASYWMIDIDGAKVNGNLVPATAKRTVVDTGSTLNYFPPAFAEEFFGKIPGAKAAPDWGAGMWAVPCKTDLRVAMTIGGVDYDVFPDDMNFYVYNETEGTCVSSIIAQSPGRIADFLLGAAFMKNVYSVHRPDPPAMGFAKLKAQGVPYAHWPEFKPNATVNTGNTTTPVPSPTPGTNSSVAPTPTPGANSSVIVEPTPAGNSSVVVEPTPAGNSSVVPSPTPPANTSVIPSTPVANVTSPLPSSTPSGNVTAPNNGTDGNGTVTCPPGTVSIAARDVDTESLEPFWGEDGKLYWRLKN